MKTVVSISGGKSSAFIAANHPFDLAVFALVRIEDKDSAPKDPLLKIEAEKRTGRSFVACAEPDRTMYAVLDLEQYLGKEIAWVTGPTFDQIIKKKGDYLPNKVSRYCTTELKVIPIFQYLYGLGEYPCIMNIGFRAGEESRAKTLMDRCLPSGFEESKLPIGKHRNGNTKWGNVVWRRPEFPLIHSHIFKDNVEAFWKGKGIRFPVKNNCVGCFWRNPMLLAEMNNLEPEKFAWFASKEGKGRWRSDVTYQKIQGWKPQIKLELGQFGECETGYCTA